MHLHRAASWWPRPKEHRQGDWSSVSMPSANMLVVAAALSQLPALCIALCWWRSGKNEQDPASTGDLLSPGSPKKPSHARKRSDLCRISYAHNQFEVAGDGPGVSRTRDAISAEKAVIVMVGLPARGKSYLSGALVRYLSWYGCHCDIFNAGNKRRAGGKAGVGADFFDSRNKEAHDQKEQMAMDTLNELLDWLETKSDRTAVGIFDATNTTVERRRNVLETVRERSLQLGGKHRIHTIFLESICDDPRILGHNYQVSEYTPV